MSDKEEDLTLDSVVSDINGTGTETPAAAKEEKFFDQSREKVLLLGMEQDLKERKKYAGRIYYLVVGWLACMVGLLGLQGFGGLGDHKFQLADSVVLAAIGATTVNVLGMLYVVANYLFPKKLRIEKDEPQ